MSLHTPKSICITLIIALTVGCTPPGEPTPPPPTDAPAQPEAADLSPSQPAEPPADAPALPTGPPPPMEAWPLAADLLLLGRSGTIWGQPLLGDAGAAQAITPQAAEVTDFAPAPGGGWLAYRAGGDIRLASIDGSAGSLAAERAGPPPDASRGRTIAWSGDATRLAFATAEGFQAIYAGAGAQNASLVFDVPENGVIDLAWSPDARYLLARRANGTAALYQAEPILTLWVELGPINAYAWLPSDGRLAFAPADGGLAVIDPQNLDTRTFIVPAGRQASLIIQRPDASLAFFVHPEGLDGPGYLHTASPSELSFSAQSAFPVLTQGLQWEPDGRRLIGRDGEGESLRLIDPLSGAQTTFEAPEPITGLAWADLPPTAAEGLTLPADVFFLAPQAGITQVWRLPKEGGPAAPVSAVQQDVTDYSLSPDGTQVVFTSGGAIYRIVLDVLGASELLRLEEGITQAGPSISFGGRRIAYAEQGIWIAELTDTELTPRRLIADSRGTAYDAPQWSPDGLFLLVTTGQGEGTGFSLLPLPPTDDAPAGAPRPLDLSGGQARWAGPGIILAWSQGGAFSRPGLRLIDLGAAPPVEGTPTPGPTATPSPTQARLLFEFPITDARLVAERVYFVRSTAGYGLGPVSVRLLSALPDGRDLREEGRSFIMEAAAVSPDGARLAGLLNPRTGEDGIRGGQLAIADPTSGSLTHIEGVSGAHSLQWGQ